MAERSEKEARSEASRQNIFFDAKLRFALLASLRSPTFSEIYLDNKMFI